MDKDSDCGEGRKRKRDEDPDDAPDRASGLLDPDYMGGDAAESHRDRAKIRKKELEAQQALEVRVRSIVNKVLSEGVHEKELELEEIEDRLIQVRKAMQMVRYGTVINYYAAATVKQSASNPESFSIHPAVRKLIGRKRPKSEEPKPSATVTSKDVSRTSSPVPGTSKETVIPKSEIEKSDSVKAVLSPQKQPQHGLLSKMPGYVPPSSGVAPVLEPRGSQFKIKQRFIVGNVSKWIQCDQREDLATHKWMMYVRGDKTHADVSDLVAKVRFLIHPSYHPHDLIEVKETPYHLTRRGWGEFPARVQIHFKDPRDKPVDVIHHLKLDKTYTGLQTLGAETVLDVWLHNPDYENAKEKERMTAVIGEEAAQYKLTETESEGWVICHSEAKSLRPSLMDKEMAEVKPLTPTPKNVLASLERENIMTNGNCSPGGSNIAESLGIKEEVVEAVATPTQSPPNTSPPPRTTYVRCKDKSGETYYLPIKILPTNNQKQQSAVSMSVSGMANGRVKKPFVASPKVKVNSSFYKTLASGSTTVTKMEAIMYDDTKQNGAGPIQEQLQPKQPSPTLPRLMNGSTGINSGASKINGSISLLSSVRSRLDASQGLGPSATPTVHHNIALSQSAPGSRFSSPFVSPQSSPCVSRCSSPTPSTHQVTPGTSLLKSNSLLKPGTSLLKQRTPAQAQSGASNEVLGFPLTAFQSDLEKAVPDVSLNLWNRVLGRSRGDSQAEIENRVAKRGAHLVRKCSEYHQFLYAKLFTLKAADFANPENLVMYIAKCLPMITHVAKDQLYRSLHPYAAKNEKEFRSWNIGKQLASEWLRAKTIKRLLENVPTMQAFEWSTREIVVFLREHGFTLPIKPVIHRSKTSTPFIPTLTTVESDSTMKAVRDALSISPSKTNSAAMQTTDDIDVVGMSPSKTNSRKGESKKLVQPVVPFVIKQEPQEPMDVQEQKGCDESTVQVLPTPPMAKPSVLMLPEDKPLTFKFVSDRAKDVGVVLTQEEIAPSVKYQAAEKMMLRACKNLCEYIIRKSHKMAYDRLGGPPEEVRLSDVAEAVASDPELAIFSNRGLAGDEPKIKWEPRC